MFSMKTSPRIFLFLRALEYNDPKLQAQLHITAVEIGSTVPSPTILKNTLLTAAFALIMSALSAQSADIPILALPFKITAPGTYVLTRNLIYSLAANVAPGSPGSPPPAITISSTTPGQIVLDLKGFSITGTVCLRIDTDS